MKFEGNYAVKLALLLFLVITLAPAGCGAESNRPQGNTAAPPDLPVISLEAKGQIVSDPKIPFKLRFSGDSSAPSSELSGLIRIHGATSQAYPKKSFGITLEKPVQWLGMKASAHWVLNAAAVDRSLMRHKLSYDLFRVLSSTNAPRFASASQFVEVNLNGKYQGVYLLMERVDRAMLGLKPYNSNTLDHACIYKAVDHAADFRRLGHNGYEQREPDPLVLPYWGPLDRFNRFVSTSKDPDFFDPAKGIASQLDLDNTIDFHLLVLITSNMDGFDKNLLLARNAPQPNTPPPRFFFVPWDYDATFGRNWHGAPFSSSAWLSNHLFERLLGDPTYRKKFAMRWKQLRQREFSLPAIYRMIDQNVQTLGPAVERNRARWRGGEDRFPERLTFQEDITEIKQWLAQRVKWLDQEIARQTL